MSPNTWIMTSNDLKGKDIRINVIDHIVEKSRIYFKLEIQSDRYIEIGLNDGSLNIFGFEYLKGSPVVSGKYSTGIHADTIIKLVPNDKKHIMIFFDIDVDYINRVNKIMENYVPIVLIIKFISSIGPVDQKIEYISCLYILKGRIEWIKTIFRLGYYRSIINFINNLMIRHIYLFIVVVVIFYFNIFNLGDILKDILLDIFKMILKI